MKTLEQLGISPAPWYIEKDTMVLCAKSEYYKYPIVDDCGNFENNNDLRLTAAAPELYEAARRSHEFLAHSSLMGASEVRKELEDALSKAGGEE